MSKSARNSNLDVIRLVAAILVLFSHCYPLIGRNEDEPFVRLVGNTGGGIAVSVFFIISGFLITASFKRNRGAVDYILRRAFRILPALAGAVIFSILLGAFLTPLPLNEYFVHPQTLDYLHNLYLRIHYFLPLVFAENPYPNAVNGSLWTLPVEVLMYTVVLALGMASLLRARVVLGLYVLTLIAILLLPAFPTLQKVLVLRVAWLTQVLPLAALFLGGGVLYLYRQYIPYRGDIALVCLAVLFAGIYFGGIGTLAPLLVSPYLIMYASQVPIPGMERLTRHGDFSYGVYVYAFPIQQLVMHWFGATISIPTFFLLSFSITMVLAVVSWKLIEAPALAYVRTLGTKHTSDVVAPPVR